MKTLALTIATVLTATAAQAQEVLSQDNSGMMVWIFLGMCALIVAMQIVPAVLLIFGITKGMAGKVEQIVNVQKP